MKSTTIAHFLSLPLLGENIEIDTFSTLSECKSNSVIFANKYNLDAVGTLSQRKDVLAIVTYEYAGKITCPHLLSENPRLDYLKVIKEFFVEKQTQFGIHPTAVIEKGANVGENVYIGAHCYVGAQVSIGDRTYVNSNVVIDGETSIGTDCYIKSGAVIGQTGFGFERNAEGVPEYFPHLGKIIIGNHVYIGANSTIDRATLGLTLIADHVKVDNLVHIAHNDEINENTLITAGVIFSGGVRVGKNCWIAPNVCIKEKTKIGDHSLVGLGAVVIRDVEEYTTVAGNPAKELKK